MNNTLFSHLECLLCGTLYPKNIPHTYCKIDDQPLMARYNLGKQSPEELIDASDFSMWRYKRLLPVEKKENIVSLGEGWTPLLTVNRLRKKYNQQKLYLKEEGLNPTGSFKARGLSMAVSKAAEYGITTMSIPTAGNAGSALAAYCAKAGIDAKIFMPEMTPHVFAFDAEIAGAQTRKVDGSISDAGELMRAENMNGDWFDVSTLKEPYRLEGKKTMGYEIAEQLNWNLPDVVIYPTGGGTGLIGIWKAFNEMLDLGWVSAINTRMVAVQIDGCNPIVQAFSKKSDVSQPFKNPLETIANGLRVPHAFGHRLILKTLYESNGAALSVSEQDMMDAAKEFAENEGIFLSPEGAAVWKAYVNLKESNWIKDAESVVLLNTGSPYKYIDNYLAF